jgi:hypothetical protein
MRYLLLGLLLATMAAAADYRDQEGTLAFAEVARRSGSPASITLTTAGTWYQWVDATLAQESNSALADASTTTDGITIGATGGGTYRMQLSCSFSATANHNIHGGIAVNGTVQVQFERKMGASGDVGTATMGGFYSLAAGDVVTVWFTDDTNSGTVTPEHIGLTILRVGP